jgi:hypothetical protein
VRVEAPTTDLDRWKDDFVGFAAQLDIIPKGGQRRKLRPNAIQAAFEATRSKNGRDIVLKPRQVGLTTWELARDVWYFLTRRGARVVIVVQSMSDDAAIKEIADKLRVMFESLRDAGIVIPGLDAATTRWLLPARDASIKIIGAGASAASAAKKGRSGTIHRLHVTELAFFEHADETLNALLECVPGPEFGTEIVLESTANGAQGWFYEAYKSARAGQSSFEARFFSWLEQSEYAVALEPGEIVLPETDREQAIVRAGGTAEQLKWYRRKVADKKSQDLVDQEYPLDEDTCWLTSGRAFFDVAVTKSLIGKATDPVETRTVGREGAVGCIRIWELPRPGVEYVVSVDPSEGVGGDPGAAVVYERATGRHVATLHGQFSTWEMGRHIAALGLEYNSALVVVERNNHGHAVLQALSENLHYANLYRDHTGKAGWNSNPVSRATSLEGLLDAHREGHWVSPDKETLAEMLRFIVTSSGRPEAAYGDHDDLIMAHAIAWAVMSTPLDDNEVLIGGGSNR